MTKPFDISLLARPRDFRLILLQAELYAGDKEGCRDASDDRCFLPRRARRTARLQVNFVSASVVLHFVKSTRYFYFDDYGAAYKAARHRQRHTRMILHAELFRQLLYFLPLASLAALSLTSDINDDTLYHRDSGKSQMLPRLSLRQQPH